MSNFSNLFPAQAHCVVSEGVAMRCPEYLDRLHDYWPLLSLMGAWYHGEWSGFGMWYVWTHPLENCTFCFALAKQRTALGPSAAQLRGQTQRLRYAEALQCLHLCKEAGQQ